MTVGEMNEESQMLQTSGYKISHREGLYSMVTMVNNTLVHTLKVARRVDPERSHHKKKNCKNVW